MPQPQLKPRQDEGIPQVSTADARVHRATSENLPLPKNLPGSEFVETSTSRRCFKVFRYTQDSGDFSVIYAGAGLGKTKSAAEHLRLSNLAFRAERQEGLKICGLDEQDVEFEPVEQVDTKNCWLVTMTPEERRLRPCIARIAEVFGIDASSIHDLHRGLSNRLRRSSGLLIIDESQHLQLASLECVRYLHEHGPVGVCLMGNERAYTSLTGGRTRAADFAPLYSRLGMRLHLTVPAIQDVEAISRKFGVVLKDDIRLLHEIALKPGALRNVTKSLRLAYFVAKSEQRPIRSDDIYSAFAELMQED